MDKDNKRHEYVLSSNAVQALNEWLEERASCDIGRDDDHLFVSLNGNGLASETLHNIVKKYTKKALGKELSPNKLRAGFCSIFGIIITTYVQRFIHQDPQCLPACNLALHIFFLIPVSRHLHLYPSLQLH